MVDWNPKPHARHAWSSTHSIFGKIALVIFYAWVWLLIVMGVVNLFIPTGGWECLYDSLDDTGKIFFKTIVRGLTVLMIGLLGYADASGFQVKNVAYLWVIVTVYSLLWIPMVPVVKGLQGDCSSVSYGMIALCPAVFGVALLLILVDSTKAPQEAGASPGERSALLS